MDVGNSRLDLNSNEVRHIQFQCGDLTFDAVTENEYGVAERVTRDSFVDMASCVKTLCSGMASAAYILYCGFESVMYCCQCLNCYLLICGPILQLLLISSSRS